MPEKAIEYFKLALKGFQSLGDTLMGNSVLLNMGGYAFEQGNYEEAIPLITQSIEYFDANGPINELARANYMFYVILLNRAQYCIWYSQIGIGTTSTIFVNVKEIFQLALKSNASGIILAHNHPSGNIKPSDSDIRITKQIKSACGFLDMILLDHLIITKEQYYSMADEGDV